jgi:hypothetical protein
MWSVVVLPCVFKSSGMCRNSSARGAGTAAERESLALRVDATLTGIGFAAGAEITFVRLGKAFLRHLGRGTRRF